MPNTEASLSPDARSLLKETREATKGPGRGRIYAPDLSSENIMAAVEIVQAGLAVFQDDVAGYLRLDLNMVSQDDDTVPQPDPGGTYIPNPAGAPIITVTGIIENPAQSPWNTPMTKGK